MNQFHNAFSCFKQVYIDPSAQLVYISFQNEHTYDDLGVVQKWI